MGGQNQVFGSKKHIFPGSAHKCPESIDLDKFCKFWEDGENPVFECKKQIFPVSAQKCTESLDFDVIFAKSGWLAQTYVFCYFLCFQ